MSLRTQVALQGPRSENGGGQVRLLDIDDVSFRYATTAGHRPVLDHVSLSVDHGEVVAVVGESGCGKTTLGRLIVREETPTDGEIHFQGEAMRSMNRRSFQAYRRAVQIIHQDPYASLNPGLTIGSILGPAMLYHGIARRRDVKDQMIELLRDVGLDATRAFLRRYPHQLSGGQRQRVAIARAMSLQPRLVVADEPTSMLDVSMRLSILDLLQSLRARHGLGYVFISHDFGVVRYFAQGGRIIVMFYGVIVEQGPTEELIRRPRHPYTFLLLQTIPIPDPVVARQRRPQRATSDNIGGPSKKGCIFTVRCPFAEAKCHTAQPPLATITPGHEAACFFPERVAEASHPVHQRPSSS